MYSRGVSARSGRGRVRSLTALLALAAAGSSLAAAPAAATAGKAVAPPTQGAQSAQPRLGECAAGELCLWERQGFRGERHTYELSDVTVESCVPLPKGASAQSFANRTGRPAAVFQSGECAETGEFHTHPSGSWTPQGEYRVRAVKIWER